MQEKSDRDKFWKLYKELPQELKDAVFSEKAAESIYSVCEKNDIDEVSSLARYVQDVLLGILKPDEFQKTIEQELGLEKEVAKKVVQEINRFIFYPVKSSLEELYSMEITPPAQMKVPGPVIDKKPTTPKRKDTYREVIE